MASPSVELQTLIFDALVADADVGALVGDRIYDGVPEEPTFPYLSFGPSDWSEENADCITARREAVQIDCWTRDSRRLWKVKEIADAVYAALHLYEGAMPTHALAQMEVTRVQVMPDPDGETAHAVVTVEARVEVN